VPMRSLANQEGRQRISARHLERFCSRVAISSPSVDDDALENAMPYLSSCVRQVTVTG
jgi:hypothetical protein